MPRSWNVPCARFPRVAVMRHVWKMAEPVRYDCPSRSFTRMVTGEPPTLVRSVRGAVMRYPTLMLQSVRPAIYVRAVPFVGLLVSITSQFMSISHDFAPAMSADPLLLSISKSFP